jgi:hypothetical protein
MVDLKNYKLSKIFSEKVPVLYFHNLCKESRHLIHTSDITNHAVWLTAVPATPCEVQDLSYIFHELKPLKRK